MRDSSGQIYALEYFYIQNGNLYEGVKALAQERSKWLDRPDKLIRASRHYEGAAQILIRQAVMTAKQVQIYAGQICL